MPFDRKCLNVYCYFPPTILAFWQHTKTNKFDIIQTFEIGNVGQDHEGEKRHLRHLIVNS